MPTATTMATKIMGHDDDDAESDDDGNDGDSDDGNDDGGDENDDNDDEGSDVPPHVGSGGE